MICCGLEHLWDLLGSSSQLIISQKTGENSRYYGRVLGRKIDFLLKIYYTCWDQNQRSESHWLSDKKVGKMRYIIVAFWKKSSGLVYLWHLLGSESHLVIKQKSWRIKITLLLLGTKMVGNAWYYTPVLTKKSITIGVGSKSHSLYSSKKLKKMLCGGGRGHARLSGKKVNNKVPCILDVSRGKI